MGLEMTCSMAGTTVPDAVSEASSGPLSTRVVRTRSRRMEGRSRSAPQTRPDASRTITARAGSQRLSCARRRTDVSMGRSTARERATAVPEIGPHFRACHVGLVRPRTNGCSESDSLATPWPREEGQVRQSQGGQGTRGKAHGTRDRGEGGQRMAIGAAPFASLSRVAWHLPLVTGLPCDWRTGPLSLEPARFVVQGRRDKGTSHKGGKGQGTRGQGTRHKGPGRRRPADGDWRGGLCRLVPCRWLLAPCPLPPL